MKTLWTFNGRQIGHDPTSVMIMKSMAKGKHMGDGHLFIAGLTSLLPLGYAGLGIPWQERKHSL
jgi:hypothetical protein